jgi:aldehyde:ferredoxin oxidoreductase
MPPGGYFGRALVVDATDGSSRILPLPDEVLRATSAGRASAPGCCTGSAGAGGWR